MLEIDRERLLDVLEATPSRVVLLVGPPGYGKTTLARQWLRDKRSTWYRADRTAADIVALATSLARALDAVVPHVSQRVTQQLRAVDFPADEAPALATTLIEDLASWPADAWLAIDDYHEVRDSAASEAFLEALIMSSRINVLITSRQRPSWASSKYVMYGEIRELDHLQLAFSPAEAGRLLAQRPAKWRRDVIERAQGWPAVVALAARSPAADFLPDAVPAVLHTYFAEELFRNIESELQEGLLRLAILPRLRTEHIAPALGSQHRDLCERLVGIGLLTHGHSGRFEIHPMIQSFLVEKLRGTKGHQTLVGEVVQTLIGGADWDDAFAVISEFGRHDLLPELLRNGLDSLLAANRLPTVRLWLDFAIDTGLTSPFLHLAEAELARRAGDDMWGEARAMHAASTLDDRDGLYRALTLAGACAQHGQRNERAATHFKAAAELAVTEADIASALWGRFVAEVELERLDLAPLVQEIARHDDGTSTAALRIANARLIYAYYGGGVEREALRQSPKLALAGSDANPFVSTLFLYRLGFALINCSRYQQGLDSLEAALSRATENGLRFALPHITAAQAAGNIGLRRLRESHRLIADLRESPVPGAGRFEWFNATTLAARDAFARPDGARRALRLLASCPVEPPTLALRGEWFALHGLALAATNRTREALALAAQAEAASQQVHARTLAALTRAVAVIKAASQDTDDAVHRAAQIVRRNQDYDNLVSAYRACPALLPSLAAIGDFEPLLIEVMGRASDVKLAAELGWEIRANPRVEALSKREREVYALICEGQTNREIASSLVLSEATVKVHVRHILGKLGARSRTEAVLKLQEA